MKFHAERSRGDSPFWADAGKAAQKNTVRIGKKRKSHLRLVLSKGGAYRRELSYRQSDKILQNGISFLVSDALAARFEPQNVYAMLRARLKEPFSDSIFFWSCRMA